MEARESDGALPSLAVRVDGGSTELPLMLNRSNVFFHHRSSA